MDSYVRKKVCDCNSTLALTFLLQMSSVDLAWRRVQRLKQSWILLINCALGIIDSFAQVLENVIYNEIN